MDMIDEKKIFGIERPHPNLMKLYLIRSILSGPLFFFIFPVMVCRYYTLRYHFDEEGISMRWGLLFRRQVQLTYPRIQDIHLISGILQRWLGLADIQIQTASGNASAEMVIEGLQEYEVLRTFLYSRMRGYKNMGKSAKKEVDNPETESSGSASESEAVSLLKDILTEMQAARKALEDKKSA